MHDRDGTAVDRVRFRYGDARHDFNFIWDNATDKDIVDKFVIAACPSFGETRKDIDMKLSISTGCRGRSNVRNEL